MTTRYEALDAKDQSIFTFVSEHIMTKGLAPTIREIMDGCEMASTSTVSYHLAKLAKSGHLRRDSNVARGLFLGDEAGMNTSLSFMCHAASRCAGTEVATHLHAACPGHVFQAWDSREFDCQCGCAHDEWPGS